MNVNEIRAADPSDVVVELKPHVGYQNTAVGRVEVVLDQQVVFINGVWSGYVGNEPGAHINLIHSGLPAALVNAVKVQVDEIKQSTSSSIAQVQSLARNDVRVELEEDNDSLADEDI